MVRVFAFWENICEIDLAGLMLLYIVRIMLSIHFISYSMVQRGK